MWPTISLLPGRDDCLEPKVGREQGLRRICTIVTAPLAEKSGRRGVFCRIITICESYSLKKLGRIAPSVEYEPFPHGTYSIKHSTTPSKTCQAGSTNGTYSTQYTPTPRLDTPIPKTHGTNSTSTPNTPKKFSS